MPEAAVIDPSRAPLTVAGLSADLAAAGLAGATVLVHTSLSSLGWVCGGPQALLSALLGALGPEGTLLMPAHTPGNTDPARWRNPPVPETWWAEIRWTMVPFDPARTPCRGMGATAELFRSWPGVVRSAHPVGSFCALGPNARRLVGEHALADTFGEGSPLGALYALGGQVLLLGVGHDRNTSLHLAEHRARCEKVWLDEGSALEEGGARRWAEYPMLAYESDDFARLGAAFAAAGGVRSVQVGAAAAQLMAQRDLVDFAVGWLERNRPPPAAA